MYEFITIKPSLKKAQKEGPREQSKGDIKKRNQLKGPKAQKPGQLKNSYDPSTTPSEFLQETETGDRSTNTSQTNSLSSKKIVKWIGVQEVLSTREKQMIARTQS